MAAFDNALDLRFAVQEHVSGRNIAYVFPRLISMAETKLNQNIRTRYQVTDDTVTFTNGEADLPADFLEMMHVYGPCGNQMRAGMLTDQKRPGTSATTYSIGAGKIYVRGYTGDKDITYYAKIPTLANTLTDSNWLLENYPDVYLYSVGLEACKHLKDVELSTITSGLLTNAVQALKIDDERARWSNSIVRLQAQTP